MAFSQATFAPVSGGTTAAPSYFTYSTADTFAGVLASSYFDSKRFQLGAGDAIFVMASDDTGIIVYNGVGVASSSLAMVSSPPLDNRIVVKEAADFSGTLDPTKEYFIDGVIDFTGTGISIEVPTGGLQLAGYSFDISRLTCSDTSYTMFTSPIGGSGNLLGKDYAIEVTGASSQVYDLVADTGVEAFEFSRINYDNCTSLGEIDGYRQGLESGTGRFGGSPNLILSGTWLGGFFIDTSIVRSLSAGFTGSLFEEGTSFIMNSRFRSNQNIDLPASASFFDFQTSNFPNASTVQIDGCIVSRNGVFDSSDTNIILNIDRSDVEANFDSNIGIQNTFEGARGSVTVEVATTGTGTFTQLLGTWTATDLQHFDTPSNGQLRHLGDNPREYKLTLELTLESTANDEIEIRVRKFDSSATTTGTEFSAVRQVNSLVGARNVAFFTVIDNVELDKNDYVFLEVRNNTAANNITAEIDSLFFLERR